MPKIWHDQAWEDYIYWQNQDKKTLKKSIIFLKISLEMATNAQAKQSR